MPCTPATFKQSDVARALRAVAQCHLDMAVEIGRDGVIRIVKQPEKPSAVDETREIAL